MIEVDLHVHTMLSHSSAVSLAALAEVYRSSKRPLVTITDYGTIEGCLELRSLLPEQEVLLGLEITAAEGDFLVFSTDEEYLGTLRSPVESVRQLRRTEDTVVIWAHPRVSQRAHGWEAPELPEVQAVAPYIDGVEVFNGTMLSLVNEGLVRRTYFSNLVRVAVERSLAMTGGSDTHDASMMFRCGTKFLPEVRDAAGLVQAIRERKATPTYDYCFFNVNISLGG